MINIKPFKDKLILLKPLEGIEIVEDALEEITDEEAKEIGVFENVSGTRIARGPDWEIWVELRNYVLSGLNKSRPLYYSTFEKGLLPALYNNRIKYWLIQEKYTRIEIAIEKASEEIIRTCKDLRKALRYLNRKYGVSPMDDRQED